MRPSASVLVISLVRPPTWRTTSPGRYDARADRVLGARDERGHPDRQAAARGDQPQRAEHGRPAGHVGVHRRHAVAGLDVQPAGVEGDALADEHDVRARPGAARPPASPRSAAAATPSRRRRRALRRSPVRRSQSSSRTSTSTPSGAQLAARLRAEPRRVLRRGRGVRQVAGPQSAPRAVRDARARSRRGRPTPPSSTTARSRRAGRWSSE